MFKQNKINRVQLLDACEVSNQTKNHKKVANKSEKEEKSDELDEI